jgi:hypothetical protein
MSKEEFVEGVKQSIKDFGDHPAVFGFYGGDEPFSDQEDNFAFTMSLLKELKPEQTHYGNLLPYWSGLLGEPKENNREDEFYYEKIKRLIKNGKLDILAYDQYTQCYDESKDQEAGIRKYFLGLHHFSTLAKMHNIPLYVSLLSVGHYSYRDPTELDIRWQINTAMMLGAKAVIWFYFHQHARDVGYLNPPFLGEKAYITPMYGKIQRQQYIFHERFKELFDNIEIDKYEFRGQDYGELNYTGPHPTIDRFDVLNKTSLTIVTYAHYVDDPSRQLMFIMNASQKTGNAYSVYFKNGKEVHFDLMPADIRVLELH